MEHLSSQREGGWKPASFRRMKEDRQKRWNGMRYYHSSNDRVCDKPASKHGDQISIECPQLQEVLHH